MMLLNTGMVLATLLLHSSIINTRYCVTVLQIRMIFLFGSNSTIHKSVNMPFAQL